MTLMQCSECTGQVSERAAACPHCGAPVRAEPAPPPQRVKRSGGTWEAVGALLIIGGMLVAMASDGPAATIAGFAVAGGFLIFLVGRFQ
jgi:hypothetical protein